MKRAVLPLILFLACMTWRPVSGNDPLISGFQEIITVPSDIDSLYISANKLYEQGDYEPALERYNAVILGGKESADLYYNMGNAAYRSNSIGHAILYYEKALKLEPAHEDAIHNLDFVSRYRLDAFEEVPVLFLGAWVKGFVLLVPEHTWSILALVFFMIILSGTLVYLFSRHMVLKKSGFISGLVALILFLITISAAISRHKDIVNPDTGIILAPSVVVRSSPSESGTELFILHEGTKIKVNEEVSGWQNIKVIDGREGWIMAKDFESI
ncbi:MAG: tetratricopeptide repeat protein [Bacteroidota bacterium]|nr:tetratricopeptide repeat protein [Bacteroidota bacterium]